MQLKVLGQQQHAQDDLEHFPYVKSVDNKQNYFRFHFTGSDRDKADLLALLLLMAFQLSASRK
jgi:ABC-2 type transport system ATP-binding protein